MCRPEKPITTSNEALRELQEWLRDQRDRTRQGYRALSIRAGCHATTLQRAASGENVPKLQTVLDYARACDASPDEARRLWRRARYEQTRQSRGGRGLPVPRPEFIRDFVDLSAAMQDLYEKAGSPTLRAMEQRAGGFGVLPRSTAHRIVTKQAMPHSLQQFQAYLRACEVPETDWPVWEAAWTRAWRHEKRDSFVPQGEPDEAGYAGYFLRELRAQQRSMLARLEDDFGHDVEIVIERHGAKRRKLPTRRQESPRSRRRQGGGAPRSFAGRTAEGQMIIPLGEHGLEAPPLF
ncbi:helix-turn-helix domain-containing protein [Streptomyces sp. 1222.5]|uniref:helix-turn-helix domain-containing protein n=1 Tax=Streptomyces sp. 1222.5 TaxID=1881026 RepID=UPI003D706501